jgi:hypothetical protein
MQTIFSDYANFSFGSYCRIIRNATLPIALFYFLILFFEEEATYDVVRKGNKP